MNPQDPTQHMREILDKLYNSAWIEGSNYQQNNPEGSKIPSERELAKTDQALAELSKIMDDAIVDELTWFRGYYHKEMSNTTWKYLNDRIAALQQPNQSEDTGV